MHDIKHDAQTSSTVRERLQAVIARQDAARGRPFTDQEKLENLAKALAAIPDEPCPYCGARDDEPCGVETFSATRRCKLEAV